MDAEHKLTLFSTSVSIFNFNRICKAQVKLTLDFEGGRANFVVNIKFCRISYKNYIATNISKKAIMSNLYIEKKCGKSEQLDIKEALRLIATFHLQLIKNYNVRYSSH